MRAVLIANPHATTTTPSVRTTVIEMLSNALELEVQLTERRSHAIELARTAAHAGIDAIISLGGDGTINEIVNGIQQRAKNTPNPLLVAIPGGSTNVFARALGIPNNTVDATAAALKSLERKLERRISLGRADERYFTFSVGVGIDAEVVRRVERSRAAGKRSTPLLYLRHALAAFSQRSLQRGAQPRMQCDLDGAERDALEWTVVQNTAPWTYLGERAVHAHPDASFDTGLTFTGFRTLSTLEGTRAAIGFLRGLAPRGSHVTQVHDVGEIHLRMGQKLPVQIDGEYVGQYKELTLRAIPRAIRMAVRPEKEKRKNATV